MHADLIAEDVKAWISSNQKRNSFAASLYDQLYRKGLTDVQINAVKHAIEKEQGKQIQNKIEDETFDALSKAFDVAKAKNAKRAKLRFNGFKASLAPSTGKNPGAVYIKTNDDLYLGKVVGGSLFASRDCTPQLIEEIKKTMSKPLEAAIAFGRKTGQCSVCGAVLENKESIARAIGPICASKFGF